MIRHQTLTERIEAAAQSGRGTVTFIAGDVATEVPWAELHADAKAMAVAMQRRGIKAGSHVAILGPTTRRLVTAIEATWLAGATAMILPLPMRLSSIEEFVDQTRVRVRAGDTDLLLIDEQLADFYTAVEGDPPSERLDTLATEAAERGADGYYRPTPDPDSLAVLQFTSGSTSDPKGVMLPHRTICANLDAIAEAAHLDVDDDVLVSWLPLYHDMGLIGKLCLPITTGTRLVLAAPQDFLARPARWMEWMSTYGGTASAAPNFAYALATRALKRLDDLDLSRWRIALNGAEPVNPATVEAFCEAGARHGLRPEAMFPAFGMAEVAIAGAFPPPLRGLVYETVDKRVLETENLALPVDEDSPHASRLARLGKPVPGLQMRIVDPDSGRLLGEREAGELEIRGTSVTTGYYRNDKANVESFRDGWFRTGDLAYMVEGELVICGRLKDLIIVGGRNVLPQDIEIRIAEIDGVRPGNIVAFAVSGKRSEQIVVAAEVRPDADRDQVRDDIAAAVREVAGAAVSDVVILEPGTMPKTSSGKLQRSLCRRRYLDDALCPKVDA